MSSIQRRSFLKMVAGLASLKSLDLPQRADEDEHSLPQVILTDDGLSLSPKEYADVLGTIASRQSTGRDMYLTGGPVEDLEHSMATLLGKERALFLPTGTLANQLAVRLLAGETHKVLVQAESHLYRDEGDGGQLLSGLNLVPLGAGRATVSADEVATAVDQAGRPPYPAPVGAISIESPVRRCDGEAFDFEEMKRICEYAHSKQIGTHLDGARLFLASAYTGISPAQYAALFDTVFVSLYKYFNAAFGAILAGPAGVIARVETLRHQFGSLIFQGWESAAVALHYLTGFNQRYQIAVRNSEQLFHLLQSSSKFLIYRVPSGTNIAKLRLASGATIDQLRARLRDANIHIGGTEGETQALLQINETINRRGPEEMARAFEVAAV